MKKFLCLFAFALILGPAMEVSAQTTRDDLKQIRVGKDGNFQYWSATSPALSQLKAFVAAVTDSTSADFVPVAERIATFDVDGTLLCETAPYYANWLFMFHRYLHDPSYTPDPADTALVRQMEQYVIANHASMPEWGMVEHQLETKAFRGMTYDDFAAYVDNYLQTEPVIGLTNLVWGTALYWPMIEVVSYLVANDFQVFLCSGVDRDICRVLANGIYEVPPYRMLTSDVYYVMQGQAAAGEWTERASMEDYNYTAGESVVRGDFKQLCTAANKIVYIRRELGMQPILSWGNSSGDYPMFHYTNRNNPHRSISFCLLCDDTVREIGNPTKAAQCQQACTDNGWVPVSMRDEWTTIYGNDVYRTDLESVTSSSSSATTRKVIHDAEVYIVTEDSTYDMAGANLR